MTGARALGALAGALSLALAGPALADPEYLRLSWDAADTARTAVVTWNTKDAGQPTLVEYGLDTSYGLEASGTVVQANGGIGYVHEVSLTGLEPSTTYHFRAGGPGGWSKDRVFTTGPADGCQPFRFVALGDNRSQTSFGPAAFWNPILHEALGHEPAFLVNTGDIVEDGADTSQWQNFMDATYDGVLQVPLMTSLGNHDDDKVEGDGATYNQLFSLPRNDVTGSEDYYFFTYGDAIFVALSTQTFTGGKTTFEEQAAWLDAVLTANPRTWKFVWFHHPIYTGILGIPGVFDLNHPPNEKGQNAALVPVFDKHHVDVVFSGHNHHYQRFEPMCCGGGDDNGVPTGDPETGTTYVITGGAGAFTTDIPFLDLAGLLCLTPGSEACSGKHHYVVVDVDGLDLHARVYSTTSQLLGNEAPQLLDELFITKSGTPPDCSEPPVVADGDADAGAGVEDVPDAGTPDGAGPDDTAAPGDTGPMPDTAAPPADTAAPPDDAALPPDTAAPDTATAADTAAAPDTAAPDPGGPPDSAAPDTAAGADPGGAAPEEPPAGGGGGGKGSGCAGGGGPAGGLAWAAAALLALAARRRRAPLRR